MSAETDSNGKYIMKISSGTYNMDFELGEDYEPPEQQTTTLAPGDSKTVNYKATRKATVSGEVLDDIDQPIVGVTVTATKTP